MKKERKTATSCNIIKVLVAAEISSRSVWVTYEIYLFCQGQKSMLYFTNELWVIVFLRKINYNRY